MRHRLEASIRGVFPICLLLCIAALVSGCIESKEKLLVRNLETPLPEQFVLIQEDIPFLPETSQGLSRFLLGSDNTYVHKKKGKTLSLSFMRYEPKKHTKDHKYIIQIEFEEPGSNKSYSYGKAIVNHEERTLYIKMIKNINDKKYAAYLSKKGFDKYIINNNTLMIDNIDVLTQLISDMKNHYSATANERHVFFDFSSSADMGQLEQNYKIFDDGRVGRRRHVEEEKENNIANANHCIHGNWDEKLGLLSVFNGCQHLARFEVCTQSKTDLAIEMAGAVLIDPYGTWTKDYGFDCKYHDVNAGGIVTSFFWSSKKSMGLAAILTEARFKITATYQRD